VLSFGGKFKGSLTRIRQVLAKSDQFFQLPADAGQVIQLGVPFFQRLPMLVNFLPAASIFGEQLANNGELIVKTSAKNG